jgi:hypothetical protein
VPLEDTAILDLSGHCKCAPLKFFSLFKLLDLDAAGFVHGLHNLARSSLIAPGARVHILHDVLAG